MRDSQIHDFSDFRNSLYVIPPGASGNVFSTMYDSQGPQWYGVVAKKLDDLLTVTIVPLHREIGGYYPLQEVPLESSIEKTVDMVAVVA